MVPDIRPRLSTHRATCFELRVAIGLLALVLQAGACGRREPDEAGTRSGAPAPAPIPAAHLDRIVQLFNRGVAHMDRFEPDEAVRDFAAVVALAPDWPTARLDLGIALLNVADDSIRARAEPELRRVLTADPNNPQAHYALGMLHRHFGRFDAARAAFERVLDADPADPDTHYQLGILIMEEDPEAAIRHLEATVAAMPHHESACYRLQDLLRRRGDAERARELQARFVELKRSGAGVHPGMKYGEMGRYAEVVRAMAIPVPVGEEGGVRAVPSWKDVAAAVGLDAEAAGAPGWAAGAGSEATAFGPGVAVSDVDGDTDLDVYVTGLGRGGSAGLFLQENGRFAASRSAGVDGRDAVGAWFGDYDADGDADLYLTCVGPNRLYRNDGKGRFADVTGATGTGGGDMVSVGAAWADADHDGDLDLYVANFARRGAAGSGAANCLWRNNGDGTFTDTAPAAGIDAGQAASLGVVFLDLDADRDADLLVLNQASPHRVFLNDRVGRYTDAGERYRELSQAGPAQGAALGDVDGDGSTDVLLLGGAAAPRLLLQRERGRFAADGAFAAQAAVLGGAAGVLLGDLDLDGDTDVLLLDAGRDGSFAHRVFLQRGAGRFDDPVTLGGMHPLPAARGAVAVDLDGDGTLDPLVARAGGRLELWRDAPPSGRHWLTVVPVRAEPAGSDPAGVGLEVEVKTGRALQVARLAGTCAYLGSVPVRTHFGLGAHAKADYVRLAWPDAQLQSELEVAADQLWTVTKVTRKASSCPILFAWSGSRFEFVTDFLGVGGLGFFVAPCSYAPPDPTEDVRIPPELLAPRDGLYLLRIAEPLEEVTYLDEVHLIAYDHPAGWEVHPDERFAAAAPFPTGGPRAAAEKIWPLAARDARGHDVLDRIQAIDRRFVEPPIDRRFVGYAADHWLEVDFGDRLRATDARLPLVLFLHGWVEYTYSHVNYAAWQAGAVLGAPRLEVPDGRGGWRVEIADAGFPAGLPRTMTLVLPPAARAAGRFRLRHTMQIYWDQVFAATDAAAGRRLATHVLPAVEARLRPLGYPREYSPDGGDPTRYDYHRLDRGTPFKNLAGDLTRFGDVRDLLAAGDDRFVIFGRGEEVALGFDARALPPLPPGQARTLVLHAEGYCKDMDLYTADGATIGPLPFRAMSNYPPPEPDPHPEATARYQRTWNTRPVAGG
jgi:hypothetical protein